MTDSVIALIIPPQTRSGAPVSVSLSVLGRALVGGSILFPDGCRGLVGIRIFDRDIQVFPHPGGWVTGNGNPPISFSVNHRMEGGNYIVRIEGYNMAVDWSHTPQIILNFQ